MVVKCGHYKGAVGWLGLIQVAWAALQWKRKEMQVKDKGHGARAVVSMYSVVILNRWGSINTFKLFKNRKGLRFWPVSLHEESILSNPLGLSQSPLPSYTLEMLIPRTKKSELDPPKCKHGYFCFWTKISGRKWARGAIFVYFHHLYLSLWKTTENLCVRMYVFFIYIYAYVCIMNVSLVATGNLLWKCNFYM